MNRLSKSVGRARRGHAGCSRLRLRDFWQHGDKRRVLLADLEPNAGRARPRESVVGCARMCSSPTDTSGPPTGHELSKVEGGPASANRPSKFRHRTFACGSEPSKYRHSMSPFGWPLGSADEQAVIVTAVLP